MKKILKYTMLLTLLMYVSGCAEDYLDTEPTNADTPSAIFETTEGAVRAVNGLARLMVFNSPDGTWAQDLQGGEGSIKRAYGDSPGNTLTALGSSNYGISAAKASGSFHDNPNNDLTSFPWWYYYRLISNANSILFYIDDAKGLDSEKQRVKAQALTFRAYAFTMLVQLYGNRWSDSNDGETSGVILRTEPTLVPLKLSTMKKTYERIYQDLDDAIGFYNESGWVRPADDFWTPNINVAYATYARAAINKLDYSKAIEMAQKARAGYPLMTVAEYKDGFYTPNQEWIWGSYAGAEQTGGLGSYFRYMAYNGDASVTYTGGAKRIVKDYYDRISSTDFRKDMFLGPDDAGVLPVYTSTIDTLPDGSYRVYPPFDAQNGELMPATSEGKRPNVTMIPRGQALIDYVLAKYPLLIASQKLCTYMQFKVACQDRPGIGNLNHFRSSEMYLIEAEAQYKLGHETEAQNLLIELTNNPDPAKKRDPNFTCTETGDELFNKLKFTAQIELWGEGFDWFMIKRWGDRIVHKSFADGGNYLAVCAGEYGPEAMNKQTLVIPRLETDYNALAKEVE